MLTTQKIWGETTLVFDNNTIHVYMAHIKKDGYSSKHYHKYKHNLLFVDSGCLLLKRWDSNEQIIETILNKGESIIVPNEQWHQFVAKENTVLLEIYYTILNHEDITRFTLL